jgi:hypothetical protein
MEEVITEKEEEIEKAKEWASKNGYDRFRIATITLGDLPDFTKSIKEKLNPKKSFTKEEIKEWLKTVTSLDDIFAKIKEIYGNKVPVYHATTKDGAKLIEKNGLEEVPINNRKYWGEMEGFYVQIGESGYKSEERSELFYAEPTIQFLSKYADADTDGSMTDEEVEEELGISIESLNSNTRDFISAIVTNDYSFDGLELLISSEDVKIPPLKVQKINESLSKLDEKDKKALIKILEYVYYNNIDSSDEDDVIKISDIPSWLLKGSYDYLANKGIKNIYRGTNQEGESKKESFSWTYTESTAEKFGSKVLSKKLPKNVVCPEYIAELIINKKLNKKELYDVVGAESVDYLLRTIYKQNFENEVIVPIKSFNLDEKFDQKTVDEFKKVIEEKLGLEIEYLGKGGVGVAFKIKNEEKIIKISLHDIFDFERYCLKNKGNKNLNEVYSVGEIKDGKTYYYCIKKFYDKKLDKKIIDKVLDFLKEHNGNVGDSFDPLAELYHHFYIQGKDFAKEIKEKIPEIYDIFKVGDKVVYDIGYDNFDASTTNIFEDGDGNLVIIDI